MAQAPKRQGAVSAENDGPIVTVPAGGYPALYRRTISPKTT
ncbi:MULTISPECIES: hypothetical protein [unclassified Brevundimonas]|nr:MULTISPECIES: hypothetical protein [unclassified Brevundimonas]